MSKQAQSTAVVDPNPSLVDFQLEVKKPRAVVEVCILEARHANGSLYPVATVYQLLSKQHA